MTASGEARPIQHLPLLSLEKIRQVAAVQADSVEGQRNACPTHFRKYAGWHWERRISGYHRYLPAGMQAPGYMSAYTLEGGVFIREAP